MVVVLITVAVAWPSLRRTRVIAIIPIIIVIIIAVTVAIAMAITVAIVAVPVAIAISITVVALAVAIAVAVSPAQAGAASQAIVNDARENPGGDVPASRRDNNSFALEDPDGVRVGVAACQVQQLHQRLRHDFPGQLATQIPACRRVHPLASRPRD